MLGPLKLGRAPPVDRRVYWEKAKTKRGLQEDKHKGGKTEVPSMSSRSRTAKHREKQAIS